MDDLDGTIPANVSRGGTACGLRQVREGTDELIPAARNGRHRGKPVVHVHLAQGVAAIAFDKVLHDSQSLQKK